MTFFYDIFRDGTERTKSQVLEFLRTAELKEHHLSNFRVTMLNPESAVVTYFVDAHTSIDGENISIRNSSTAGWAKRDAK